MTNESMVDVRREASFIAIKLKAIAIIAEAPLWPKTDLLSESGKRLYDAILADAKAYAMSVAEGRYSEAFEIAAKWPAHNFMEETLINAQNAMVRMANRRMLRVCKHYIESLRVEWDAIRGLA